MRILFEKVSVIVKSNEKGTFNKQEVVQESKPQEKMTRPDRFRISTTNLVKGEPFERKR